MIKLLILKKIMIYMFLKNSNDVVVTESNSNGIVNSNVVSHEDNGISNNFTTVCSSKKRKKNDDVILSTARYEELCNKFKSGANLNLEELRALKKI
ncbi:MAG: hypothetical protein L6V81_09905 [Clostridium sp.]|nr:MAG: hypothetical protein L6V81_09905 [Clostridium sp.]